MHEIEPSSFCALDEYYRYLEKRRQAADISLGGLYLVLASLDGNIKNKEAFKFPILAKHVDLGESSAITADLLNIDLRPEGTVSFSIRDGLAVKPNIKEIHSNQMVREMYIKDYEDFFDGDGQLTEELSDFMAYPEFATA